MGSATRTARSTIRLNRGTVKPSTARVLTVDYAHGGVASTVVGDYTGPTKYQYRSMEILPKALKQFVKKWSQAAVRQCGNAGTINVVRHSHQGYALAVNNWVCSIPGYAPYQKTKGRWHGRAMVAEVRHPVRAMQPAHQSATLRADGSTRILRGTVHQTPLGGARIGGVQKVAGVGAVGSAREQWVSRGRGSPVRSGLSGAVGTLGGLDGPRGDSPRAPRAIESCRRAARGTRG